MYGTCQFLTHTHSVPAHFHNNFQTQKVPSHPVPVTLVQARENCTRGLTFESHLSNFFIFCAFCDNLWVILNIRGACQKFLERLSLPQPAPWLRHFLHLFSNPNPPQSLRFPQTVPPRKGLSDLSFRISYHKTEVGKTFGKSRQSTIDGNLPLREGFNIKFRSKTISCLRTFQTNGTEMYFV